MLSCLQLDDSSLLTKSGWAETSKAPSAFQGGAVTTFPVISLDPLFYLQIKLGLGRSRAVRAAALSEATALKRMSFCYWIFGIHSSRSGILQVTISRRRLTSACLRCLLYTACCRGHVRGLGWARHRGPSHKRSLSILRGSQ